MYITERQLNKLSKLFAVLAEPHEEREIRARIGYLLLDLLQADHYASYVWDRDLGRFDRGVSIGMSVDNLGHYESYYQFNDPITLKLQLHHHPMRVTDILAQQELLKTEFFNDFLYRDGLYWGINMYAWSRGVNIGDLRIWRSKSGENFEESDLAILNLIKPAFIAALDRCQTKSASQWNHNTLRDILSEREAQVVELLTQGLVDKEIARRMDISFTTVRTHIGHIFHKLNVDSRAKLICLLGNIF